MAKIKDASLSDLINETKKHLKGEPNKGLTESDFKIIKGKSFDDYVQKYGSKSTLGVKAYKKADLGYMKKNKKYYELKEGAYISVPNVITPVMGWVPMHKVASSAIAAAVVAGGTVGGLAGAGVLLSKGDPEYTINIIANNCTIDASSITGTADSTETINFSIVPANYVLRNYGLVFEPNDTGATATIVDNKIEVTVGHGNATLMCTAAKPWYDYTEAEKWWEYCSNGGPGTATEDDIGKEVEITLNTKVHKIRLIDVDHLEPGENEGEAQAHCTFEFVNLITKNDNSTYYVAYDATSRTNCNFLTSDLNVALQPSGAVYQMFPTGVDSLLDTMTEVTKYVAHNPSGQQGSSNYSLTSYTTKLFPLAYYEISATSSAAAKDGEGNIYSYYQDHTTEADRLKKNVNGSAGDCVLRSPTLNEYSVTCMWEVEGDGDFANNGYVYFTRAVAPAFCI